MSLTREQLLLRQQGIGSSDVPVILGLKGSMMELWLSKTEPIPATLPAETKEQRRGNVLEAVVARLYDDETGHRCETVGTLAHPAYDWWMATPDRLVTAWLPGSFIEVPDLSPESIAAARPKPSRILEIKTRGSVQGWSQVVSGAAVDPDAQAIRAQCLWQLGVVYERFGISVCDVAVLGGHYELEIYTIERDPEEERALFEICGEWWRRHIIERTPPPPDATDAYSQWASRYRKVEQKATATQGPLFDLVKRYKEAWQAERAADEQAKLVGNQLRNAMLDLEKLETPIGNLTFGYANGREKIEWEQVARMLATEWQSHHGPEAESAFNRLVKAYTTRTEGGRRLVPRWKDEV